MISPPRGIATQIHPGYSEASTRQPSTPKDHASLERERCAASEPRGGERQLTLPMPPKPIQGITAAKISLIMDLIGNRPGPLLQQARELSFADMHLPERTVEQLCDVLPYHCPQLRHLDLSGNGLHSSVIPALRPLKLKSLDMRRNPIDLTSAADLFALHGVQSVWVSDSVSRLHVRPYPAGSALDVLQPQWSEISLRD